MVIWSTEPHCKHWTKYVWEERLGGRQPACFFVLDGFVLSGDNALWVHTRLIWPRWVPWSPVCVTCYLTRPQARTLTTSGTGNDDNKRNWCFDCSYFYLICFNYWYKIHLILMQIRLGMTEAFDDDCKFETGAFQKEYTSPTQNTVQRVLDIRELL